MTSASERVPPAAAGEPTPLPPGLDILWGRRGRGKRGPRPELSPDAIVAAAVRVADADGLEAVSMARVASELGFSTMSLYRYVASKDELLQLMWNASAQAVHDLVLEGDGWRERLRNWALAQREQMDRHPWITQMPMGAPPLAPNSLLFVERGLETMDGTGLTATDKIRMIGIITSFTLNEARIANDTARAARAAREVAPGAAAASAEGASAEGADDEGAAAGAPTPTWDFEGLLRQLVDERTYPRLHRLAWAAVGVAQSDEHQEFEFGLDRILDGVQAYIDRARE